MGKQARVPTAPRRERARIWPGEIPGSHEPGFVEQPLVERPDNSDYLQRMLPMPVEQHYAFDFGECTVILTLDATRGEARWHLSISHPTRHPTWDEIKTARYRLLGPDLVMAMVLPRAEDYVNVPEQDHVMQLWQLLGDAEGW